jgi:hypothetical protein
MDDEILEADGTADVLEEVLQSVTAQALRMGRVEDGVLELKTHTEQMQQAQQQLPLIFQQELQQQIQPALDRMGVAGATSNGGESKSDHAVMERLDELEAATKRTARHATWTLFLSGLQMILIAGLLGQSYIRLQQMEPPAAPVAAPTPPQTKTPDAVVGSPAPAIAPPETVGASAPPPPAAPVANTAADKADKHHKKPHKK